MARQSIPRASDGVDLLRIHNSARRNDFSPGGNDFSVGGNDFSVGGNDFSVGVNDFSVGGYDFSVGGNDFSVGRNDFSVGGNDLFEHQSLEYWLFLGFFELFRRGGVAGSDEVFEFGHELRHVLEFEINRRKSHVSDLI